MKFRAIVKAATMLVFTMIFGNSLQAEVALPKIFGNDMVLQRGQKVPVWGWADAGEKVTVKFDGQSVSTKSGQSGKWQVELAPLTVGDPRTLTVEGKNTITLGNVLVGEVWLCSGQSNMEYGVRALKDAKKEIANANHPNIRLFFVPRTIAPLPSDDLPKVCQWRVCTPQNIKKGSRGNDGFSGTAYYYGRELHKKLGVPVGIIQSAWDGTPIEPWTTIDGLKSVPEVEEIHNHTVKANRDYQNKIKESLDAIKAWEEQARKAIAKKQSIPSPPNWPRSAINDKRHPTALYNAMIHPMAPFAIKGAIWYQGEANLVRGDGEIYYKKMQALIQGWRQVWKNESLPFYFVQLAPYIYRSHKHALPVIWEAQNKALQNIPHTGMAIINDIGNCHDIHPQNKQEVGRRLALWALAKTYKQDIDVYCGPVFKSYKITGDKIRVSFEYSGSGLASRDGKALNWFEIAGTDNKYVKSAAVIEGHEVVVSAESVSNPVSVRFAWDHCAVPNLMNKEGLPASAFRFGPNNLAKGK